MELLVLKSGKHYIRKVADEYTLCTMEKAGVYPVDMKQEVLVYKREAEEQGLDDVALYQMTITEKKLDIRG